MNVDWLMKFIVFQPKILIKQKQKYNLRFVLMYDPNRLEDI
ncbi:Uncharacterised protein [Mycobacteroides abscessus subsp. abscessus]|nr:Uncharacterised protein [Mycobacteroides abscessus subsp. abscessus]